ILKPSDGRPVTIPTQDMIIGINHLTTQLSGVKGEGRKFASTAEAIMAYDAGELALGARVTIRMVDLVAPEAFALPAAFVVGEPIDLETTLGRAVFNDALPEDYPYVNEMVDKKRLSAIVNDLAEKYPKVEVAASLDALKEAGFRWATRSGVTISFSDVVAPASKPEILNRYETLAESVQDQYDEGLITDEERRHELIEIWTKATDEVDKAMRENFPERNTVYRMVSSGARGNWMQVRQIAGMRGLVADPKGEIIPRPIKSNYREGLSVVEYFIATHGARKGLADTALRTADSGYLTRRLVDVSQDVIVREEDCGTERGLTLPIAEEGPDGRLRRHVKVETSVFARTLATDVEDSYGNVLGQAGIDAGDVLIDRLIEAGVREVKVRSVLTCESRVGTCAMCYGRSLATGKLVDIGEAVGIIAAQSIGEPGTQLTMRTFHTGGVAAADDITQGLPRVQELFEARTPKGEAPIAEASGRIKIDDSERLRQIIIVPDDGTEEKIYLVSKRQRLKVEDGGRVEVGAPLTVGAVDPKKVLRVQGARRAQEHLVQEVQSVYRSQGVDIHDKHIEVIVRQMLRRVTVLEPNDTTLLPGELVTRDRFEDENRRVLAEGGRGAQGRPELMGITKASLATDSWLSAASFQETTRVLTEAAISGRQDPLLGLKENVIIGKLIPAGTGLPRYRQVVVEPTEEAKAELYPAYGYEEIDYPPLGGESVIIDDLDAFGFDSFQDCPPLRCPPALALTPAARQG
ncbi:MAG: DNA-directed RNA polymerase subunit beta', partial [Bifidobacteriaceae bacterium]|nr:DNA-directed RNA polymerase subunit beta' [Bifidobacteriaceae bacterium]